MKHRINCVWVIGRGKLESVGTPWSHTTETCVRKITYSHLIRPVLCREGAEANAAVHSVLARRRVRLRSKFIPLLHTSLRYPMTDLSLVLPCPRIVLFYQGSNEGRLQVVQLAQNLVPVHGWRHRREDIGGHGRSSAKEGPNQEMPVTADDDPKTRYASFELLVR
jgi:hypothetical protein